MESLAQPRHLTRKLVKVQFIFAGYHFLIPGVNCFDILHYLSVNLQRKSSNLEKLGKVDLRICQNTFHSQKSYETLEAHIPYTVFKIAFFSKI